MERWSGKKLLLYLSIHPSSKQAIYIEIDRFRFRFFSLTIGAEEHWSIHPSIQILTLVFQILGVLDLSRDAWVHREDWMNIGIHVGSGRKYKDSYYIQAQATAYINSS